MRTTDGEATFLYYLRILGRGIPEPVREHQFDPTRKWRFDFAWIEQKVAVEIEGKDHQMNQRYTSDMEKYNAAITQGWRLLRFRMREMQDDPTTSIDLLKKVLNAGRNE